MSKAIPILFVAVAFAMPSARAEVAGPLSFDEAVSQILSRSTSVGNQQAAYGSVHAQALPIRLAFTPALSFDANQTYTQGVGTTRQVEGVAQMNLFRWGADLKAWEAASWDESQQRWLIEDAALRGEFGAVAALVNFIRRKKEVIADEGIVKARQDSLAIAQQRYAGGYLPLQESERVSVDLANANARLADAQVASVEAASNLENLLGTTQVAQEWPWKDRFAAMTGAPALPQPANDAQLAELLSRRPDWRAAQAKADAEEARLSRDWRLLGPSLDGKLSYGYYYTNQAGYAGATDSSSSTGIFGAPQWTGLVTLQLPFFDHLTLYSNARSRSFVRTQADLALEQVRRDAKAEWDSARQAFVIALGSAQVRDKTLTVSRRLYQDNLQRFRNGRINADDLFLEQTRLYDSELFAVQGWASVHIAYAQLCKAQGLRLKDCKI